MLASGCRLTEMSLRGIRVSVASITELVSRDTEVPGLFLTQGYPGAEQAELHRVTADRSAGQFDLGTFDQAEHHQTLNERIRGIDRGNCALLTALQRCESCAVDAHEYLIFQWVS